MKTQVIGVIRQGSQLAVSLLLLTSVMAVADTPPAYGCSCMRSESVAVERDRATAVFAGEVTSITPVVPEVIDAGEENSFVTVFPRYVVDFEVSDQWKGEIGRSVRISTANNSAACGYDFMVGEAYLVYTYGEAEDMSVGLCGRTRTLANATDDISELEGTMPAAPSTPAAPASSGCDEPHTTQDEL